MRLGLIGTGRIGALHAANLCAQPEVTEVLIADLDTERARRLAGDLGARAVERVDDLYDRAVDGVVIAAATSAHAALLHRALDARTPVFCEKPVALDIPGTRRIVAHAETSGVPLQVGFQRRFDHGYRTARQAVTDGALGRLHTLRAVTADQVPPHPEYLPTSGGLFRDCGIHDFDAMNWLTGRRVLTVQAMGANGGADFFRAAGDVDTCAALLRWEGDLLATVTATRYNGAGHDVRLEVCGSTGTLVVGLDDHAALPTAEEHVSWRRATPHGTFAERFDAAYAAELRHFTEVVAGRAASDCTARDALEALYVAEACERSRVEERPVAVEEVRTAQWVEDC